MTGHATSIRPEDRLGITLFLAAALHAIVILGVSFDFLAGSAHRRPPTLEVTLVRTHSAQRPEDADYLAQANQEGAGNTSDRVRPQNTAAMPAAIDQSGNAATTTPAARNARAPEPARRVLTDEDGPFMVAARNPTPDDAARNPINVSELLNSVPRVARLSPETGDEPRAFAQRPREAYVSARTREYQYASYEEAWRAKVERIGNLNFPEAARREGVSGTLLLDVALNADGTVHEIRILRSSGHGGLDEAAIGIVRMAAPYAPFPESIRRDIDVLHLVRRWQFESDRLSSR